MEEVDNLLTTRDSGFKPNVPVAKASVEEPSSVRDSRENGLPTVEEVSFARRSSGEYNVGRVDKNSAFTDPRSSRNGSRIE